MKTIKYINFEEANAEEVLNSLVNKSIDAIVVKNGLKNISDLPIDQTLKSLSNFDNIIKLDNFLMYPLPYSVVHQKETSEESEAVLNKFFDEASNFNANYGELLGKQISDYILNFLKKISNDNIKLLNNEGKDFPLFNIRKINEQENYAIEIHCENSFISQLNENFRSFLYENVDLENAMPYYCQINKPDEGGDLVIFDKEWDDYKVETGKLSSEIRNDSTLFFKNVEDGQTIKLDEGDFVIFRGAQIWHCISKIKGNKPRLTIGGFVAKDLSNPDKFLFWS